MSLFATHTHRLALTLAALSLSTAALAQFSNAMVKACRSDAQNHCSKVTPGGGRVALCLKQNEAVLSPECKAQLGTISECSQQVKDICGAQASTPSALRSCFATHANAFSATCRSAMLSN